MRPTLTVHVGDSLDVLRTLPDESVDCVLTSPPYFQLRDYGVEGQLGMEDKLDDFLTRLWDVAEECRRVLTPRGVAWWNLGDTFNTRRVVRPSSHQIGLGHKSENLDTSYAEHVRAGRAFYNARTGAGLKDKDLLLVPHRFAIGCQERGWWVRSEVIWRKPYGMPENVSDRPTRAHEHLWLLTKSRRYHYDAAAIAEPFADGKPGRNVRDVWNMAPANYRGHGATMPVEMAERCILAGCPEGGTVLDPFFGAGTTGLAALSNGRNCIGVELNAEYAALARERLSSHVT